MADIHTNDSTFIMEVLVIATTEQSELAPIQKRMRFELKKY